MVSSTPIVFRSPEFWQFYDVFCAEKSIKALNEDPGYLPAAAMREITRAAHQTREIYELARPERGWTHKNAWLSLATVQIRNEDGELLQLVIRAGDVVVIQHQWDREVLVTHSPIVEYMQGYLLSGRWDEKVGLFLPLFDVETIARCIQLRLLGNARDGLAALMKESIFWNWPPG